MKEKSDEKRNDLGIDVKKPKASCDDIRCPWHGHLKVRGKVIEGLVRSDRGAKTVVVVRKYYQYISKYERYERRKSKILAYNPACIDAKTGNTVKIAECRPLSKMKSFVVIEKN